MSGECIFFLHLHFIFEPLLTSVYKYFFLSFPWSDPMIPWISRLIPALFGLLLWSTVVSHVGYDFYVDLTNQFSDVASQLHELIAERCRLRVAIQFLEVIMGNSPRVSARVQTLKDRRRVVMGRVTDLQR